MPVELIIVIAIFIFLYWLSSGNDRSVALLQKLSAWLIFYERPLLKTLAASEATPAGMREVYARKARRAQYLLTFIHLILFGPLLLGMLAWVAWEKSSWLRSSVADLQ